MQNKNQRRHKIQDVSSITVDGGSFKMRSKENNHRGKDVDSSFTKALDEVVKEDADLLEKLAQKNSYDSFNE
ncbi:MAG: hypothetical protein ACTSV2_08085 [Candidatus Thorarchaeota archaeon]